LVAGDQPELDGGRGDALLEVEGAEAEVVAEELDDVVLARVVVRGRVHRGSVPWPDAGNSRAAGARGRVRAGRVDRLDPRVAARAGDLSRAGDRGRLRRGRGPADPLGEGGVAVAARV